MAFRSNPAGIRSLFSSGDVGKHLRRLGQKTAQKAKQKAGFRTGNLRANISAGPVLSTGREAVVTVSAQTEYATFHHEGTKPHIIIPRTAKALRFTIGNQVVFAKRVVHPGTKPNRFLTDALREVVR